MMMRKMGYVDLRLALFEKKKKLKRALFYPDHLVTYFTIKHSKETRFSDCSKDLC